MLFHSSLCPKKNRIWIRGSFILVFLLGLTWTFGLLYLSESTVAMAYVFTILNSFQGFFIFFLHCFQDEQVRKDVYKALNRHGCLPTSCLSGAASSSSNTSATSPNAGGKDNQTIFYGSSGATSAGATLTASDALTTATVSCCCLFVFVFFCFLFFHLFFLFD